MVLNIQGFLFPDRRWLRHQTNTPSLQRLRPLFIPFKRLLFTVFYDIFLMRDLPKGVFLPLLKSISDWREEASWGRVAIYKA